MAKKKKPKKKDPKKRGGKPKPRPRQINLPEHEGVRDSRMDQFCEDIFDARGDLAKAKEAEQGALQGAMKRMIDQDIPAYTAHGVRLILAKGEDKITAKIIDANGVAGGGTARANTENAPESDDTTAGDGGAGDQEDL